MYSPDLCARNILDREQPSCALNKEKIIFYYYYDANVRECVLFFQLVNILYSYSYTVLEAINKEKRAIELLNICLKDLCHEVFTVLFIYYCSRTIVRYGYCVFCFLSYVPVNVIHHSNHHIAPEYSTHILLISL